MTTQLAVQTPAPFIAIHDEMSLYMGHNDDNLKEALRAIEGVPNTTYLVVGDHKVFVFDKLVAKVKEHQQSMPDAHLVDFAKGLVPLATVAALEAIKLWGIEPSNFSVKALGDGFAIHHKQFDAFIPEFFTSKALANEILARLLVGGIDLAADDLPLPGLNGFSYRGQEMVCQNTFELPGGRPVIKTDTQPDGYTYKQLTHIEFESGFSLISPDAFTQVKDAESSWCNDASRMKNYAYSNASRLWVNLAPIPLANLSESNEAVPEYGQDALIELRALYPELSMLSDWSLYDLFDTFQRDCFYARSWAASRDDQFLFFLIGSTAVQGLDGDAASEAGALIAFAMLNGVFVHSMSHSFKSAVEFWQECNRYSRAISTLAGQVASTMRFLADDKNTMELRGAKISVFRDVVALSRSKPIVLMQVVATQDLSDLADTQLAKDTHCVL